jgi:predicted acetyltransferase
MVGLLRLESQRFDVDLPEGRVPATFLVAVAEGQIVGRVSIRHALNAYLAEVGGHIGYGVRPGFRRKGYATAILRQSIVVASSIGLERVLVTCDEDNVGSAKVIENCGGALESVAAGRDGSMPKRRYWVETGA